MPFDRGSDQCKLYPGHTKVQVDPKVTNFMIHRLATIAAVAAIVSVFNVAGSQPAHAACKPGFWLNKDGTCTPKGLKHCNVRGVNWYCKNPSATTCRLTSSGQKLCL